MTRDFVNGSRGGVMKKSSDGGFLLGMCAAVSVTSPPRTACPGFPVGATRRRGIWRAGADAVPHPFSRS